MASEQFQEEEVVEPNIAHLQLQTLPVFPQEFSGLLSRSFSKMANRGEHPQLPLEVLFVLFNKSRERGGGTCRRRNAAEDIVIDRKSVVEGKSVDLGGRRI